MEKKNLEKKVVERIILFNVKTSCTAMVIGEVDII